MSACRGKEEAIITQVLSQKWTEVHKMLYHSDHSKVQTLGKRVLRQEDQKILQHCFDLEMMAPVKIRSNLAYFD